MSCLKKYLGITFAFTWLFWSAEAVLVKYTSFQQDELLPMILFTIGGFGPTIAALLCFDKNKEVKNIVHFIFYCRKKSVFMLLLFIALEIVAFGVSSRALNPAIHVFMIPLIVLQAVFFYGGNEELGWRGVLQPILQKKMSYPMATLIVGLVWAVWHMPLWFIEGNSHQGSSFALFALLAILLSYWLAAIINSSGSVFYCMILHGITNSLLSIFVIKVNGILVFGLILLTALAAVILIKKQITDSK